MFDFLYGHFLAPDFHAPEVDLSGRVACVTGSNGGLGYESAKHLARAGVARLILAVRDTSKGDASAIKLKEELPDFHGEIEVWKLDMASFASVKAFGDRLSSLERLDILIASAGILNVDFKTTPDGWEETLQVNVIATGLLALLALPKLSATADLPGNTFKPHACIVASEVHFWSKFPQQDAPTLLAALNDESQALMSDRYNLSKLLDIFITREIAKLPAAQKVVVNTLTPGLCVSELRRDMPWIAAWLFNKVAWSTSKGERNYFYAATQETTPGAYIAFARECEPSEFVRSEKGAKVQKKLFNELKEVWIKEAPQVAKVLE